MSWRMVLFESTLIVLIGVLLVLVIAFECERVVSKTFSVEKPEVVLLPGCQSKDGWMRMQESMGREYRGPLPAPKPRGSF